MSTHPQSAMVSRRGAGKPTSMFLRMMLRAAVLRRGRAATALLAMAVAAAAATAMLNLYVDVQAKLGREFRNYGANVIVTAKNGQALPAGTLPAVESTLGNRALAVPFAYVVARTASGQPVVVAGTDFSRVRKLDTWWSVTGWPSAPRQALLGDRVAAAINPQGQAFDLTFQGHTIRLLPAGIVQTGAAEDSRIYLSLADFEAWTGVQTSVVEIAVSGSSDEVRQSIEKLQAGLPSTIDVHPVRQIVEGEARVLGKTRSALLASAVLIIMTAALCVLATLIGWVYDRRRDFAIMKALGASQRLLNTFFAAEAGVLGVAGAVLGFAVGVGIAAWIGRANFHAPISPRFSVFPVVLAGSVTVALLSAIVPISLLRRVQPANILKGE